MRHHLVRLASVLTLLDLWTSLTLRGLEDDGGLGVAGSLERSNDCGGRGHLSWLA